MRRIVNVPIIAVLAVMLVSMNRRSPTRSFSLGATRLAGVVLPERGGDEGGAVQTGLGGEEKW